MATTGPFNGTTMQVYVAGTALGLSTSFDLSINAAEIDVTSKDSGGWKDVLSGLRDWSVSADGIISLSSDTNAEYLSGLITNRTQVNLRMSTETSGDGYWHGSAYVTSLSISAPMEDKVTFSATFVGDGQLTLTQKT
jgi:TP901-1 family phage major tail protein